MRVLLLIILLTVPAYAGPGGYFSDANYPPRVSVPGTGFSMEQAVQTAPVGEKTIQVLPAQTSAPIVTVPTVTPTPANPSSVPPILTAPQDQLPGVVVPGRPQPGPPAGF